MCHFSFIPLLCLLLLFLVTRFSTAQENDYPVFNTSLITAILNKLTDKNIYDKRLRPKYGSEAVDVGITIHVTSISAVSEVDMDFTLDFYLRQTWQDPRLAFGISDLEGKKITFFQVGVEYLDKLWKPDTFFPNEKKSYFHVATTHNSFLRINTDGTVLTSQRLTVTATCPMMLQLFPMDSQKCKLEIESYGYTSSTIHYHWCGKNAECSRIVRVEQILLPSHRIASVCLDKKIENTTTGSYSRLWLEFVLKRESSFYMLQIFAPATLVVFISWVSFWISRDSPPSRATIGTLTILTETHLLTGTNRRLPPVSYIKAVDVYLGFCYLYVVLAFMEYACVAYAKKKKDDYNKKFKKLDKADAPRPLATPDLLRDARIDECTCPHEMPITAVLLRPRSLAECFRHSRIDLYARFVFPTGFFVFSVAYWLGLLTMAGFWQIDKEEVPDRRCSH